MNKAKLFICHDPNGLFLNKKFVQIIKKYDKDATIILFKVNHPHFSKFDFEPYKECFDKIIEFDFIDYKRNFLIGFWEIFNFHRKLKRTTANFLRNFEAIDLFLIDSAWLSVNVLLYNLSKEQNIKNIYKTTSSSAHKGSQYRTAKLRTFLCALYSLFFSCYKIKAISTLAGQFANYVYVENVPGIFLKMVNPTIELESIPFNNPREKILPYPIMSKPLSNVKKDMIIVFGDSSIFKCYREYFSNEKEYFEKLTTFFQGLENKYPDCELYYKPHPGDGEQLMPGISPQKYRLFDNTMNAQMLIEKFQQRIKAVYTFSSVSVLFASFFGIPSYTFYRYLFSRAGEERFDNIFNEESLKSKFLLHLKGPEDIGKIDYLRNANCLDFIWIEKKYREALNI